MYPPGILSGLDPVVPVERVIAVDLNPQRVCFWIDRHPKAVPNSVGEDLLHVRTGLAWNRCTGRIEGIVSRHGAVVVQPENDTGQMGIVGFRSSELIVVCWRRRTVCQILQPAAAAVVPDDDVQLAVGAKANDS